MKWFDKYGHIQKEIPQEAVDACAHQGECYPECKGWQLRLGFVVPRKLAIDWLREFGAWDLDELKEMSVGELSIKVLWLACSDIKENGEWLGLVH